MSNNNTQLPVEVVEQIKQEAQNYMAFAPDNKFSYIAGATEYATKLHLLQQELNDYKEMHEERRKLVREIDVILCGDGAAQHPGLCDLIGPIRKLVQENERLNDQNKNLHEKNKKLSEHYTGMKAKGEKLALALRRLSRSVSVHPEFSNDSEWGDYVSGAEAALEVWEGERKYIPVPQQGAVWIKCIDRLPDSWHLKCARFIHTKTFLLDPENWLKENERAIRDVEWSCETGSKQHPLLPANDAVQNWFEENIDKECSASSAIYKFRVWLESLQGQSKEENNPASLIQNIYLSDIDAPVFTHSPQFKEHFDYIKSKFIEIVSKGNGQEGNKEREGLEWLHNDHIEFCYRHPDGRVDVRYRRIEGTEECDALISEVNALIEKAKPAISPYFYRKEGEKEFKP
jgi:hypothetical protein